MKAISQVVIAVVLLPSSVLTAQDQPQFPKPQKEHEWLQQFVGDWETESAASAAPGQPEMKCTGTINSRMLGGFWVVSELKTEMMGTQVIGLQTIGFDPASKRYIGTWVDSMMNHMWKYDGWVDDSGKVLTLEAEGPNFLQPDGKASKFRDIYEFKSKNEIVMTSTMQGEDGKWITFMTGTARRKVRK